MRLQRAGRTDLLLPPLGEPPAFRGDEEDPRPEGAGRYEEGAPMAVRPEMKEIMQNRKHRLLTVVVNPPDLYHHFLGWWVLGGWVNEKNKFVNSNGHWLFVGNDLLITCRFTKS